MGVLAAGELLGVDGAEGSVTVPEGVPDGSADAVPDAAAEEAGAELATGGE